jgi:N-acetylglucosaminyl-diphospho-decaprenol L-rhamnosyltransferase
VDLSIIIVNWNSKDYLRKCLTSILAETHGLHYEIVVVDSGSFDGCGEMLREHYPQVRFIQSTENLGFSKANNLAFRSSTGRLVLFLNPDTELRGPAINLLIDYLKSLPKAGVVGCKLLNSDGSIQTSCIQAFPTILNQLLNFDALRSLFPRSRLWGTSGLFDGRDAPSEVDSISGACLMISRNHFEQAGKFSTDYFMYSEDVDLCFQVRKAGLKSYYVPTAVIVHHGGTSAAQSEVSTFSSVMLIESRWRFFRKTRSSGYGRAYRASILAVSLVRIAIASVLAVGNLTNTGARWRAATLTWKARLRWSIGLEDWINKYRLQADEH